MSGPEDDGPDEPSPYLDAIDELAEAGWYDEDMQ